MIAKHLAPNSVLLRSVRFVWSRSSSKMSPVNHRGAFIVFEGCDKSGKSTQCGLLVDRLNKNGVPAQLMKFPAKLLNFSWSLLLTGDTSPTVRVFQYPLIFDWLYYRTTSTGEMINKYLQQSCQVEDHAIHLLFAANRWEAMPKMTELLNAGVTLVVDRYSFSGVAFSSAKPDLTVEWCRQPERGLLRPDEVLYLSVSTQVAAERGDFGTERYEKRDFQAVVAERFQELKDSSWTEINADKSVEDLSSEIFGHAMNIVNRVRTSPLQRLWV